MFRTKLTTSARSEATNWATGRGEPSGAAHLQSKCISVIRTSWTDVADWFWVVFYPLCIMTAWRGLVWGSGEGETKQDWIKSRCSGLVLAETWRFITCPLLYKLDSAVPVQRAAKRGQIYFTAKETKLNLYVQPCMLFKCNTHNLQLSWQSLPPCHTQEVELGQPSLPAYVAWKDVSFSTVLSNHCQTCTAARLQLGDLAYPSCHRNCFQY